MYCFLISYFAIYHDGRISVVQKKKCSILFSTLRELKKQIEKSRR